VAKMALKQLSQHQPFNEIGHPFPVQISGALKAQIAGASISGVLLKRRISAPLFQFKKGFSRQRHRNSPVATPRLIGLWDIAFLAPFPNRALGAALKSR